MKTMHPVHLAGIDLNLLVALEAMLEERNVTRAAKRVGLTQPAMSHALSRLRDLLGDPLFVRAKTGMEPTARARALAPTLSRALSELHSAMFEPAKFDPATAKRTFTIATSDYMELVLFPDFLARIARAAPQVKLVVRSTPSDPDALSRGAIDLAIRPVSGSAAPGLHTEEVFRDRFVLLTRAGHPLTRGKLTLDRFCAASHVLVSPRGVATGLVDDELARLGRTRHVALVLAHFLVAPHVVAATDLVITIGEHLARAYLRTLPLSLRAAPLDLPPMTICQAWHDRQAHDPALAWLRGELRRTARELRRRADGRRPAISGPRDRMSISTLLKYPL